jgi:glutamyl-tRNA reductase
MGAMDDQHALDLATQTELEKAYARLARGADPLQVLEALGHSLTNKLLHPTIEALKRSA